MDRVPEAAFLGACVTDLISYSSRFPNPGETLIGKRFLMGYGGKGANSCIMSAKLDVRTALIATLGTDTFGRLYKEYLSGVGVNTDCLIVTDEAPSAAANILVTDSGENCIVYVGGVADLLTPKLIHERCEQLFKSVKLLCCVLEAPVTAVKEALTLARRHKVKTFLNAAPKAPHLVESGILGLADIVCVNEGEAEMITGIDTSSDAGIENALRSMLKLGCQTVIMTLGSRGVAFVTAENTKVKFVPAPVVKAVDTTGAGDAFNGAFVFNLIRHPERPLEEMLKRACAVAAISVTRPGTQSSYPTYEELPAELR